jgi:hypothetical protein
MEARGSKTLIGGKPMRQPNWLVWAVMKGFRVVVLTVLWAALGMGVGLFVAIFVLMTAGALQHRMPNMELAYRDISIPLAIAAGGGALVWNLVRVVQAGVRRVNQR